MKTLRRLLAPLLFLAIGLWACQDQVLTPEVELQTSLKKPPKPPPDDDGGSQLTTFELTPLSYVVEGAVFDLQVVAIGKKPGEPLKPFNGTVTLAASPGGIDPGSLTLTKGIGSAAVTLGASSGETVTVTASAQGKTGELTLDVGSTGDVYIVYGQSNAVSRAFDGSANENKSSDPAILSFGAIDATPGAIGGEHATNPRWHLAEGDDPDVLGFIGQWPIRMARQIVDTYGVEVTVLNGARGGTAILELQRNDDNPTDPETIYGRLLSRAQKAGVADQVRAILYYQGETDGITGTPPGVYAERFRDLYEDWKTDYPAVAKVYVFQTRGDGCVLGDVPIELRDAQRQFEDEFDDLQVISTTGLDGHDGCHFSYQDGYKTLGETTFRLISRDLYGSTDTENIDPPYIDRAYFSNPEHTEVTLAFRDPDDTLVWDPGSELYFRLEGVTGPSVVSGSANGSTIVLQLSGDASGATGITYLGHGFSGPWVTNTRGVGALTFYNIVIE
jgi:hypothetical protein